MQDEGSSRMSLATPPIPAAGASPIDPSDTAPAAPTRLQLATRSGRVVVGGGIVLLILLVSFVSLWWTLDRESAFYYARQVSDAVRQAPRVGALVDWFG